VQDNGYCARGGYCKYSHGDDALVPGVFPIPPQIPGNMFMPMFPPGLPFGMGPPATYDPHEARLDMRTGAPPGPMGRAQRSTIPPRVNGDAQPLPPASGELPVIQDLTPAAYSDEAAQQSDKHLESHSVDSQPNGMSAPTSPTVKMEVDDSSGAPSSYPGRPNRGSQNSPARGRGARPGVFGGDVQRFHPERRDKTLVVEKIPEDKLSLDAVNGWFKRFGTVTNVAVDAVSAKALVSFSTHEEAHAAWKTEDAVFGNRFVKVFWHRPMGGQGLAGQRALAASAPIVASVAARDQAQSAPTPDATSPDSSPPAVSGSGVKTNVSTPSKSSTSAFAARQKLLEQQIAEQKALMEKLNTASAEEKKEIFAQLRKLGQEIKTTSSQAAFTPSKKPSTSTSQPDDREAKERERLDKELELHSAAVDGEETTEALQAKLAKLKAEVRSRAYVRVLVSLISSVFAVQAASLGIDSSAEPASPYPYRGRGRGRGRGFYRGSARGGPPRASMKLDNRPKKLLIKDVGSDSTQAVRDWYEAGGQVDAIETLDAGDVVVTFRTRAAAEQVRFIKKTFRSVEMLTFIAGSRQGVQHSTCRTETNQLVHWFTATAVGE
jgi:RNA-binding protein 26